MSAKTKVKNESQPIKNSNSRKNNTKRLVLTAVLIALAAVLSMVKVYQLPLGGSITLLSMLPIALISIEYGIRWGMTGAFAFSIIQLGFGINEGLFGWGLSPLALWVRLFWTIFWHFRYWDYRECSEEKGRLVFVQA